MKPPNLFQWLIGNAVVSIVLMLGGLYVIYAWFTGSASGVAALIAVVLGAMAARASERVNAYSAWKREWNGTGSRRGFPSVPAGGIRTALGLVAWAMFAMLAASGAKDDSAMQFAIGLFWIVSAMMAATLLWRALKKRSGRRSRMTPVAVSLARPLRSASIEDAVREIDGR